MRVRAGTLRRGGRARGSTVHLSRAACPWQRDIPACTLRGGPAELGRPIPIGLAHCGTFPGPFPDLSRTFPGPFPDLSRTFAGPLSDLPGPSRTFAEPLQDPSRTVVGHFPARCRRALPAMSGTVSSTARRHAESDGRASCHVYRELVKMPVRRPVRLHRGRRRVPRRIAPGRSLDPAVPARRPSGRQASGPRQLRSVPRRRCEQGSAHGGRGARERFR